MFALGPNGLRPPIRRQKLPQNLQAFLDEQKKDEAFLDAIDSRFDFNSLLAVVGLWWIWNTYVGSNISPNVLDPIFDFLETSFNGRMSLSGTDIEMVERMIDVDAIEPVLKSISEQSEGRFGRSVDSGRFAKYPMLKSFVSARDADGRSFVDFLNDIMANRK